MPEGPDRFLLQAVKALCSFPRGRGLSLKRIRKQPRKRTATALGNARHTPAKGNKKATKRTRQDDGAVAGRACTSKGLGLDGNEQPGVRRRVKLVP